MSGLIKKILIICLISGSAVPASQALTWGHGTVQVTKFAAQTAFCVAKGGVKLIYRCLPEGVLNKVVVGGVSLGAGAVYMRCPKVALGSLAVAACSGYLNYLYRSGKHQKMEHADEITPGGPRKIVMKSESERSFFTRYISRYWQDRKIKKDGGIPNHTGVIIK